MRILTVRQPWAWAIIHGGKDVENRVRNIAGSYRGPVAIHAGLARDDEGWASSGAFGLTVSMHDRGGVGVMTMGAIIGVVNLVDVHLGHNTETNRFGAVRSCFQPGQPYGPCSPWAEADTYHLVLHTPRPLSEPIPYKGALGLRTVPAELQARIEAAL